MTAPDALSDYTSWVRLQIADARPAMPLGRNLLGDEHPATSPARVSSCILAIRGRACDVRGGRRRDAPDRSGSTSRRLLLSGRLNPLQPVKSTRTADRQRRAGGRCRNSCATRSRCFRPGSPSRFANRGAPDRADQARSCGGACRLVPRVASRLTPIASTTSAARCSSQTSRRPSTNQGFGRFPSVSGSPQERCPIGIRLPDTCSRWPRRLRSASLTRP